MTAHWPVLTMVPSGSSVSELSSTRVIVPFDPVMTRTRWTWPNPPAPTPTRKSVGWTSVPESLIPPDADHVPVNGPMMTVAWIVTGTEVLAAAGAPAVPSSSSTGVRHTPMNDSRRMAPPYLVPLADCEPMLLLARLWNVTTTPRAGSLTVEAGFRSGTCGRRRGRPACGPASPAGAGMRTRTRCHGGR